MGRGSFAWAGVVALGLVGVALLVRKGVDRVSCGPGFEPSAARCVLYDCQPPLIRAGGSCEAAGRVAVPRTRLLLGPSDWEAEGRVASRVVEAGPFWLDAFEATTAGFAGRGGTDALQAAFGMTRDDASAYCGKRGGRLPTEDEWVVAAAGVAGHRYPWGDTGAVCRRAAFGLANGPCAFDGKGPDSVGSHPDGDGALGIHDLAGNVAEWVAPRAARSVGVAKGGSWRSSLATELRVWERLELDPESHDDRVGVRCAYDAP